MPSESVSDYDFKVTDDGWSAKLGFHCIRDSSALCVASNKRLSNGLSLKGRSD